ncbi:MAG: glycoside hydrolase family 2 protein, partial [Ruthenibacterium sp.]
VYSDLLRNHKMKDPFYRDNEMDACRLMDCDYIYERTFVLDASLCSHDTLLLECDGLDSLCHIFINGREIAFCNNMHRVWTFDIRREVRVGGNHIALHFDSPNRFVREAYAQCKADGASDCTEGFPHLRKAHCMFGWDWGPRLPDAGIWRNIQILAIDKARLLSVYVCQAHEPGKVTLSFEPEIQTYWPADNKNGYTLTISVIAPDGQSYASDGAPIVIRNPQLWWPNGYGAQPLYHVQATLYDDTQTLDCWTRQVGL